MKKLGITFIISLISFTSFSQDAKEYYKSAKKLYKLSQYDKAIEELSKAISKDKEYDDAYFLRAECYEKQGSLQQAAIDYKIAARYFPKKKDVQFQTAKALIDLKQYEEALPFTKKVLEIDAEYVPGLELDYIANYYNGSYTNAKSSVNKAIEGDKENPKHYFYQGLIAFGLKDMPTAEAGLVECAKRKSDYPKVYTNLAEVRLARKVYDKAIATCDVAIKQDVKDSKAYYIKSLSYEGMGKPDLSIKVMDDLISVNGIDKGKAFYQKGLFHVKMQLLDAAKQDFSSAIKDNERYVEAYDQRAAIYEKQNEYKLASNDYKTLVSLENLVPKEHKQLIEKAKQRLYEINKESDPPKILIISHTSDDKNTIDVKANQPIQNFKIQFEDASLIKSIAVNAENISFNNNTLNPFINQEIDASKVEHIRVDVEDIYLNKASETFHLRLKKIEPPKITLSEPYASTNGETYIDKDIKDLFVEGKISHSEKIKNIKVNGVPASYLHDKLNPVFSAKIDVSNLQSFQIEVEGEFGTTTKQDYKLIRTEVSVNNPMGKTWVVFIENSNYQNFSSLEGPTKDINLIKTSLGGYSISKVIHKKDMSKDDLARFFSIELRDLIKKNRVNSLMVWYAGHGKFVNETGYWIPTDAKRDEEYSYYNINTLRASMQSYDDILVHNLVITDACESGPSFYLAMRDTPKERVCGDWEATKFRSAQVLSSAGYELAVDNSQFTKTFAAMLSHNPDDCIPIEKISNKVIEAVSHTGTQKPSLGKIKGLQDQNGTFFFIKKQ